MSELNDKLKIVPARRSAASRLPVRIALVDYKLVGIHENVRPDRVLAYLRDFLLNGYRVPAVSVFQQQSDSIFETLPDGKPAFVSLSNFGQFGVADGHHRFAAITLLDTIGLLPTSTIPVQVLPVRDSGIVRCITKNIGSNFGSQDVHQLTISDIESCFSQPHAVIPPNVATLFEVRFADGTFDRIRLGQPDLAIDRLDFLINVHTLDEWARSVGDLMQRKIDLPTDSLDLVQRLYRELTQSFGH